MSTLFKFLCFIIGLIVLIPIAAVIAVIGGATLVGGWIAVVLSYGWQLVLAILALYIVVKIIKHFFDK